MGMFYMPSMCNGNRRIAQLSAALTRANAGVHEANGRFLPTVGVNARYSESSGVDRPRRASRSNG